jgi:hypothetical protein
MAGSTIGGVTSRVLEGVAPLADEDRPRRREVRELARSEAEYTATMRAVLDDEDFPL